LFVGDDRETSRGENSMSQVRISFKITPGAARNEILGLTNDIWRIKIAAPPDKGKANKELIEFLSDILGIKKDRICILKGQTSHNKILTIEGLSIEETHARLSAH
jgi:uncharacterized protein (TIGR00251 family)